MVKQDPVELESVVRKFNLKDSRVPIDSMLEDKGKRGVYNNLSSACTTAFITFELFLTSYWYVIHPLDFNSH